MLVDRSFAAKRDEPEGAKLGSRLHPIMISDVKPCTHVELVVRSERGMTMPAPTNKEILRVLESNVTRSLPDGTFEVALVLGGTVSAGAYTAGFLDKLIEALDAWYVAKTNDDDVPDHDVKIRVAAGASGGGVCAAILARALAFGFPHISPASSEVEWDRNPFYKTWVQELDIAGFVETNDIAAGQPLKSLFNDRAIGQATKAAAAFQGGPLPASWLTRPYVDSPFRVIVTLANLTGVPYEIDFGHLGRQS